MKNIFSQIVLVSCFVFLTASNCFAAGGGDPTTTLIYNIINFGIFLFAFTYIYKKFIKGALQERSTNIRVDIEENIEKLGQSEASLKEIRAKLEDIESLKNEVIESLKKDGEEERSKILSQMEEDVQKLNQDTELKIKAEYAQAEREVRTLLADEVVSKAKEALKSRLNDEVDHKLRIGAISSLSLN